MMMINQELGPKELLDKSSSITTTLADVRMENFVEKYLKMAPVKIINLLKGFSIAASVLSLFIPEPEDKSKEYMEKMEKGFNKILNKIDSQTGQIKAYIDKKDFQNKVKVPLKTLSRWMRTFYKRPEEDNKNTFLEHYKQNNIEGVIDYISENTEDMLMNFIEPSEYNWKSFHELCTVITHKFHIAFTIGFFAVGVQYDPSSNSFKAQQKNLANLLKKERKKLSETIQKANKKYESTFFPSYVQRGILEPAIDEATDDNCKIAELVVNQLKAKNPRRKYLTIVSDSSIQHKGQNFASNGFTNRLLVSDDYKEKSVTVFMASKEFAKHKKQYDHDSLMNYWQEFTMSESKAIKILMQYGNTMKSKKNGFQMAAFFADYKPCVRRTDDSIHKMTTLEVRQGHKLRDVLIDVIF